MKIIWQISQEAVDRINAFISGHKNNFFVQTRINRNINGEREPVTINVLWDHHVACLATTQQRSGPGSNVGKFVKSGSFLLKYPACLEKGISLEEEAQKELSNYHLRRSNTIAKEITQNIAFIRDNWNKLNSHIEQVVNRSGQDTERSAANYIQENLRGFGPKQSRNLLQSLGIARYEIPIDSRITKWLNKFGFPVYLTATALGDPSYYNFISDGFQELAHACGLYPCVLDAIIFSSYDNDGWTEENIVW